MIKKLLFGMVFIAGLTACNGDYTDWASPQSNAQNDAAAKQAMTVTPAVSSIDFATETAESIKLFTTNLQAGQTDAYTVTFTNADATQSVTVTADADGCVSASDLKNVVSTLYGKAPTQRTLTADVTADVDITTEDGIITAQKSGEPFTLNVTLDAPYISEHYYIVGAPSAWELTNTTLPFTHSDQNVYDDPVFTVTFPVTEGEVWFAVSDDKTLASGEWSSLLGCAEGNGNNGMSGGIIRRSEAGEGLGDCSWKLSIDANTKYVRMSINMMDYTYSFEFLSFGELVYLPGDANGWTFDSDCLRSASGDGEYTGFAMIGGEWGWKITPAQSWDKAYGNGGSDGVITDGGGNIMEGSTATLYYAVVNLANLTYQLTPITDITIIGGATGDSSWSTDLPLTQSADNPRVWTYTGHLDAGEFKFRMNYGWDVNLGGEPAALWQNGANCTIATAGDYTLTLTLSGNGLSSYTLQ